jgi:hypothetical protein
VLGGITGAITGSATSASYAANTSLLNNSGSGEFVPTGSFNTFSSSVLTYTGSVNSQLSALQTTSGSNITRLGALESASGSAITRLSALEVTSGSNITRISALETASGSAITRLSSLESRTGSYTTTGSNTFDGGQYLSSSFNPTGFSTTASLYTDGGLRVTKDAYISGTLYLNNVTVYGTQSVCYITSSQLNIASNLITVNTATPSVQFGGLAVYDSGSSGLTGSILWDSTNNHWVYSNPSGSSYSGGMFISGPRSAALGSETGTTACMLLAGQGGDHLTSSMIYHSSTVTCIPNILIGSTVCSTMVNASCIGIGTTSPITTLQINATSPSIRLQECSSGGDKRIELSVDSAGLAKLSANQSAQVLAFETVGSERMRFTATGESIFACQVCAPGIYSSASSRICGNLLISDGSGTTLALYNAGSIRACISMTGNEGDLSLYSSAAAKNVYLSAYYDSYINAGKVGIGLTNPSCYYSNQLVVSAGSEGGITIANPGTTGAQYLMFADGTSGADRYRGYMSYNHTDNSMTFATDANTRFTITGTGISCFACQVCMPATAVISGGGNTLVLKKGTGTPAVAFAGNSDEASFLIEGISGGGLKWYTSPAGCTLSNAAWNAKFNMDVNGIATFSCTVCAPQYITTQGSSVSYAAGTNYTVWNSEIESCIQDNNNPAAYTRIKTWIADRSGCATMRFTGYIASGPTYWGYRVTRNGTSSYMCVSYSDCAQPGCAAPYVHSYSSYQFNVGPFLPGDCIGLDVVSTGGGATPSPGQGQYIFAKEFRVLSTTPNFSAGTSGNVFGEWVGIGTCTPFSNLYIQGNNEAAYNASIDNGQDGCGVTLTIRNNSTVTNSFSQLNMQVSGDSGRAVGRIVLIRTASATGDMAFVNESGNTKNEVMRLVSDGKVAIGTNTANGYVLRLSSNTNNNPSCAAKLIQMGNDVVNAVSGFMYIGSYAGIDWLVGKDTCGAGDYRFNLSLYTGEQRMTVYTNGNYSFAGSNVSDLRLKSNINNLCISAISKINQLTPKCYNMDGVMRYGFIAQDVKPIISDLVTGEEKEKEYLGLDYNGLLAVAIKGIQEQQCTICAQSSMINTLKTCLGIA